MAVSGIKGWATRPTGEFSDHRRVQSGQVGYLLVKPMTNSDQEQFKRTVTNVREHFKYLPEITAGPAGEEIMEWDLELESRYRDDGKPTRDVDLNFGRAQVSLRWVDSSHCVLRCQSAPDERGSVDLAWGGRRAVLAVHRYTGRVVKIRGVERAAWLGHLLVAYCAHGGAKEYDTTDLMRAAAKWSSGRVQSLLKIGIGVNDENMMGETALSYAAREGRPDIFEILLGAGARIDVSFEDHTLLHDAAVGGSVPILSNLIRSRLQINTTNWMGLTPLWYAVSEKRIEAAEYLLAEGADWRIEPWKTKSAYPKMKEGFRLVNQAEAVLGFDHRLTKMLRGLDQ